VRSLDDYLAHNPVTGLLIARDDTILDEHSSQQRPRPMCHGRA
jgi:hypothetical protein